MHSFLTFPSNTDGTEFGASAKVLWNMSSPLFFFFFFEVVAHTFNPSSWELHIFNSNTGDVETGKDMVEWREQSKMRRGRSSCHSV